MVCRGAGFRPQDAAKRPRSIPQSTRWPKRCEIDASWLVTGQLCDSSCLKLSFDDITLYAICRSDQQILPRSTKSHIQSSVASLKAIGGEFALIVSRNVLRSLGRTPFVTCVIDSTG